MVEFAWTPRSPLQHAATPGRRGAAEPTPGVTLCEITGFSLIQIMARRGRWQAVEDAASRHFGISPPGLPVAVEQAGTRLIWSGPDQFLVLATRDNGAGVARELGQAMSGIASLSDQSDARALIRIGGVKSRDLLAKFCSLDLHPAAFPLGCAAATAIDHTGVNLWRGNDTVDGMAVFNLLVFTSFSESIWHMIVDSAAEYGLDVSRGDTALLT